jgi:hypothetical protein
VTDVYKAQLEPPKFPCEGEPEKPVAAEGTLCVWTGGGGFGHQESEQVQNGIRTRNIRAVPDQVCRKRTRWWIAASQRSVFEPTRNLGGSL